jgi:hypothetical protein
MDLQRYIPPNLRPQIRDARNLGYSLLDNVIGFDDGFESAGERLGTQIRTDPIGTGRAVAQGIGSGVQGLISDPVGAVRGAAQGFGDAYQRARVGADSYLPEGVTLKDASMDQIRAANEAYLADVTTLSAVVPAGKAATSVARAASNIDAGALTADAIGAGRAISRGDTGMLREVFQRGGEAQGLSADIKRVPVRGRDPQEIKRLEANIGLRDERGRAIPSSLEAMASQFDAFGNRISNIAPDKKTGKTFAHPASGVRMNTALEDQAVSKRTRGEANPRREVKLKVGDGLIAAFGDRAVADVDIEGYSGKLLDRPISMYGGSGYIRDNPNERIWASDEDVTGPLLASLIRARQDGLNPYMIYTSMGPQSSDFATNDLIRDYIRDVDVDPALRQTLADKLRASKDFTDKDFPYDDLISGGNSRRNTRGLLDGVDNYIANMNGSNRRAIWQAMDSAPFRDAGIPIGEMRLAQTDPDLLYANAFDSGLNLGRPDLSKELLDQSAHPIYPTAIAGDYAGSLPVQVPAAITFRNFFNSRRGLLEGSRPSAASSDQRSFLMSHGNIVQPVDQQMVDELGQFTEYWRNFNR